MREGVVAVALLPFRLGSLRTAHAVTECALMPFGRRVFRYLGVKLI
jgi:hypothetical protein